LKIFIEMLSWLWNLESTTLGSRISRESRYWTFILWVYWRRT